MSQKQNQINIELTDEISKGKYANLAMIAHSSSEFVIDFIQLMPGVPKAKVNSRIIITPEHARFAYLPFDISSVNSIIFLSMRRNIV